MFTLLRHQYDLVSHILTHSFNSPFSARKSGFKNNCRDEAGFGLVLLGQVQVSE